MTTYETRTIAVIVAPPRETIFSESATTVNIEDDAAGEFVVVSQNLDGYDKIAITPEEWPAIRAAIDALVADCRPAGESQ